MYISSNQIFLRLKAEDILDISIKAKDVDTFIYKITNEPHLTIRIIRKSPLNLGYLLGKLEFLNIAAMDIFKLYDNKKAFHISFSEKVDSEDLFLIEEIIKNSFDMSRTTTTKTPLIKRNDIKIDCNHTAYLASMHIIAKDQKGLFAYVAKIFDDFKVEIESAKLHTLNGYARDLILIEKNGNFCSKQEEIVNLICIKEDQAKS
jgi:[protein-PII] uridylyltransferase